MATVTGYNYVQIDLKAVIKGHKFPGKTYEGLNINGSPVDLTDADITINICKNTADGSIEKTLTVGSGITITDAAAGTFQIDAFEVDLNAGKYYYDIKIETASLGPKYYIWGYWTIKENTEQ